MYLIHNYMYYKEYVYNKIYRKYMNYKEFVRNIKKSGLNLNEFAALLKMTPQSLSNLKNKNKVPKHLAIIAILIGEMGDKQIDFLDPIQKINIEPQKRNKNYFGKQKT